MTSKSITQERLKELLKYDSETGVFIWVNDTGSTGRIKAGSVAGSKHKTRMYIVIGLDGARYQAHRLAWLYMTGDNPAGEIDHINHIRHDNRFENLRSVTKADNCKNKVMLNSNSSGVTGVSFDKKTGKWESHISVRNKKIYLGRHSDKSLAIKSRLEAEVKYGYHKNHGRNMQ